MLSHDGSLLTCASTSLLAALLHHRIPASEVKGGQLTVFNTLQRDPVPLALLHHPVCLSMAFFLLGNEAGAEVKAIVDPVLLEEQIRVGELVVGANKEGEVVLVEKNGGIEVEGVKLLGFIDLGVRKAREILQVVSACLENDARKRDRGGLMSRELRAENER